LSPPIVMADHIVNPEAPSLIERDLIGPKCEGVCLRRVSASNARGRT
jgi:hypothetical protein